MLIIHWSCMPILCSMLLPKYLASACSFGVIFFMWCINFIALQLESPFGEGENDLPMVEMQRDWNKSLGTLLWKRAHKPPDFDFHPWHRDLSLVMSDGQAPR